MAGLRQEPASAQTARAHSADSQARPRRWPRSPWAPLDVLVTVLGLLAGWTVLAWLINEPPLLLLPPPWNVASAFVEAAETRLAGDVVASMTEGITGWVVGCGLATIVGLVAGRFTPVANLLMPVIEVLRPISPLVWVPLGIVWFGIGFESKLFIVALTTFFIVVVSAYRGARSVSGHALRVADMVGMNRLRRLATVEFMAALPDLLVGWRLALAAAWGGVVISELVAANEGLGALQFRAIQAYDIPTIIVGMVCFAALGLLSNAVYQQLEKRMFPWSPSVRERRIASTTGGGA